MKGAIATAILTLVTGAIANASDPPVQAVVERDGVRVEVMIRAQDFAFEVTNVGAPPIMGFEIGAYHTYNHLGPERWTLEFEDQRLRCSTDDARAAIARGRKATFTARVSSNTATLGTSDAVIGFGPDRPPVTLTVWAPVRHPRSYIATIAGTLIIIAVLHGWLVGSRLGARVAEGCDTGS